MQANRQTDRQTDTHADRKTWHPSPRGRSTVVQVTTSLDMSHVAVSASVTLVCDWLSWYLGLEDHV